MKISTLDNISYDEIANAFNIAFSDYYHPIKFTGEQLANKFLNEGGRSDLSVGVFDNNSLVGFILHFVNSTARETLVYNGGTGIAPDFRGVKLVSRMYEFILPILIFNKVNKMRLEVLVENAVAINMYKKQGFKIIRELDCFKGKLSYKKSSCECEITSLQKIDWNDVSEFWDFIPTWQNSIHVMNNLLGQNVCLGAEINSKIIGYIIYNPIIKKIHQIAVHKSYRKKGVASQLLNAIEVFDDEIYFINADTKCNEFKQLLESRGLLIFAKQFEMEVCMNYLNLIIILANLFY